MEDHVPQAVLDAVLKHPGGSLVWCCSEPITGSSGAATGVVTRLSGLAQLDHDQVAFTVIRKACRPVTAGRHAAGAADPRHWAYWRREPLAYASGLLPEGPGLTSPRCYGVIDDVIYLADVGTTPQSPHVAAHQLGRWQANSTVPDVPWLSGHQLAQRIAVSELDWTGMDVHPHIPALWRRRRELLKRLDGVPRVLVHGDFSGGNLIAADDGAGTVVLDWATFGVGPVGADLASLTLTTLGRHLADYLDGSAGCFDAGDVELGYRVTLALTGAGRIHWMLSRGMTLPAGYIDFITTETASL
ncbi:phosphotransferase [Microbispora corallina]|uniref:phosphotransferase n=1 Tax=Microbispora corallina TaxID=83302 RepID=UPI0019512733|nr:phosphotransferase [Microbispora corallina]